MLRFCWFFIARWVVVMCVPFFPELFHELLVFPFHEIDKAHVSSSRLFVFPLYLLTIWVLPFVQQVVHYELLDKCF